MARPTHVTVTAPEGRRTPVASEDGIEPGGGQLQVTHGAVRRVRYSQTIARSIGRGDLLLCNMDGKLVESADLAAAPKDLEDMRADAAKTAAKKGG